MIVSHIAIFRALQLGDLLCIIPAVRALRKAYPLARITLISLPWAAIFCERFPDYFDDFISFPGYPGLPEQNFNEELFSIFLKKVQSAKFDLVLQMQGNGTIVNELIKTFGAKYIAGFCPVPQISVENEYFMPYPDYGHEILRHLQLMSFLGVQNDGTTLEFPLNSKDIQDLENLDLPIEPKKYICIHPGSRSIWRQWPPLYFAAAAEICYKAGYKVVLTGTKEELEIVQKVARLMTHSPVIAAGKTSLGAVGVLIDRSFALISNCTGVSHIAAALKKQSIVISMDGEPERWVPLDHQRHPSIDWIQTPDFHLVQQEIAALFFRL